MVTEPEFTSFARATISKTVSINTTKRKAAVPMMIVIVISLDLSLQLDSAKGHKADGHQPSDNESNTQAA